MDDVLAVLATLERAGVPYASPSWGAAMAAHDLDRGARDLGVR